MKHQTIKKGKLATLEHSLRKEILILLIRRKPDCPQPHAHIAEMLSIQSLPECILQCDQLQEVRSAYGTPNSLTRILN